MKKASKGGVLGVLGYLFYIPLELNFLFGVSSSILVLFFSRNMYGNSFRVFLIKNHT